MINPLTAYPRGRLGVVRMSEKPILFITPMVQAILDGCKTQTRRIVKPQPSGLVRQSPFAKTSGLLDANGREIKSRYKVGDILWVREAFRVADASECGCSDFCNCCLSGGGVVYKATELDEEAKYKPSIFMPKRLARIWLKVTNVRVEKLKYISRQDAIAEGIEGQDCCLGTVYREYDKTGIWDSNSINSYRSLWNLINAKDKSKSWEANPYVWVYEFRRIENANPN